MKKKIVKSKSLQNTQQKIQQQQLLQILDQTFRDFPVQNSFFSNLVFLDIGKKQSYQKDQIRIIRNRINKWQRQINTPIVKFLNQKILSIKQVKQNKELSLSPILSDDNQNSELYLNVVSFIQKHKQYISQLFNTNLSKQKQTGFYYLNNYVVNLNKLKYIEFQDNKIVRKLSYHIWNFQFQLALAESKNLKSIEGSLLQSILKGYCNIQIIISKDKQQQKQLANLNTLQMIFHKRSSFLVSSQTEQTYKISSNINVLCSDISAAQLTQILNLSQSKKIILIRQNLEFIIKFCNKVKDSITDNGYIKLMFIFLGNLIDKKQYVYSKAILDLQNINQIDKYIFSSKFIQYAKQSEYRKILKQKIDKSSNLYNLILCNKTKEKKNIMQNYLDKTQDLKTIAYLSLYQRQPQIFQIYIKQYKEILKRIQKKDLLEDFLQKQAQLKFQQKNNSHIKKPQVHIPKFQSTSFFLNNIDFQNRKFIQTKLIQKQSQICSVCSSDNFQTSDYIYIQCQKCYHGGHSKHILNWFQKNQRCPKSDCICLCN